MRWFCCLLSVVFVLFQGCDHTKPQTSPPVTFPAQGVGPIGKLPADGAPQRAIQNSFFDPNNYSGSDIERINAALNAAGHCSGTVRIGKRKPALQMTGTNTIATLEERDIWVIDSAILIPGNTHLIIDNTTIKLSNISRDNMIRSANCRKDCNTVPPLKNIRITGVGNAVLEGADIPRATGDAGKLLAKPGFTPKGRVTFGSDAGKAGEHQKGDWRNIGILLVKVNGFSIENLTIRDSHCWAISLESCTNGKVRDIQFDSRNGKEINGKWQLFRNQDGLDLRRGCRDILIENITGRSGDDLIALTAIPSKMRPAGTVNSTMMLGGDEKVSDGDVYNITIRNVRGYSAGGHHIIRFLNTLGVKMYNITLDGVIDTSPAGHTNCATVKIGDSNKNWGGPTPLGDTYGFHISNIHSRSKYAILVAGSLQDSAITNVVNSNPDNKEVVTCTSGKENMRNVHTSNLLNVSEKK
jgi:hypothetical protein